jgi:hypothetical protein
MEYLIISMGKASRFKEVEPDDVGPTTYYKPDTIGKIPKYLKSKDSIDSKLMTMQFKE